MDGPAAVWERPDGVTELIFGAYDSAVHFVDAATGQDLRPEFQTGDIIKGSVSLDPDGFPLLYFGSRDNQLRILALDREEPTVLWSMDANEVNGIWNDDWDSNPAIVDDIMYEGGENGWFFAVQLNRGYDAEGKVVVDPVKLVQEPGYNEALLANSGRNVSIDSLCSRFRREGLLLQLRWPDRGNGRVRRPQRECTDRVRLLRRWRHRRDDGRRRRGDDLRVHRARALADERGRDRAKPRRWPADQAQPLLRRGPQGVGLDLTAGSSDSGSWSTPAVRNGVVYVNTHQGSLIVVDAADGTLLWRGRRRIPFLVFPCHRR